MRTFFISILIMGIWHSAAKGQDFKTNTLTPLSLSYEHYLPDHQAIQFNIQYKPQNLFNQNAEWFRTGIEYRIYKGRKIKLLDKLSHEQRGRYLAPYLRYSICNNTEKNTDFSSAHVALGLMTGYKRYQFRKYTGEVFGGLGISPWVSTTNQVLAPKREARLELVLGATVGISYRKKKKDGSSKR